MAKLARIIFLSLIAFLLIIPGVETADCYGNSAEPPSILIIAANAPDDLEIILLPDNIKAFKTSRSYETYYYFYSHQLQSVEYTFRITTGGESFLVELEHPLQKYNNIYTLNLGNKTLSPGKSFSRSAFLIFSRVVLTLLVEGLLFFLFGYRQRRSWLVFITVNLLTQLTLFICLNGTSPFNAEYIIFTLILAEILIFIIGDGDLPASGQ
jgi:hypothetical protein